MKIITRAISIFIGATILSSAAQVAGQTCPTVTPVDPADFDIDEWTRATWYVQEQQVNSYQPAEDLFCVTATYNLEGASVPFFSGTVISVYNRATKDDYVDDRGPKCGRLCGRVQDANAGSTLSVAPCFLPNILTGPYWPVYIARNGTEYTAAVVTGGAPNVYVSGTDETQDVLCTTCEDRSNGSGLWIFSRVPEESTETLDEIKDILKDMGISTDALIPVVQGSACEGAYENRFLKPRDCDVDGACNPAS